MCFRLWTDFYRGGRGAVVLVVSAIVLAGCQTPAPPPVQPPAPTPGPGQPVDPLPTTPTLPEPEPLPTGPGGLVLPHMEGRDLVRIGLLLPFSAKSSALREEARSMLSAAQLALFEAHDPRLVLLPKDTGGTETGAQSAAQAVINDGASVILGPVLGSAVLAAAMPARQAGIPVIAFSTDRSVAGDGIYLLSFLPEADTQHMIDYIKAQNMAAFETFTALRPDAELSAEDKSMRALALLRPDNGYGDRIEEALFTQTPGSGLFITDIARYSRNAESMSAPARQIAHVDERNAAIQEWENDGGFGDPGLDPSFVFALPYQAVFIPESGVKLRSLAPLLPFYDVDPKITRFIGTSLWYDDDLLREPALFGGWFPASNAKDKTAFTQNFERAFDEKPGRLASLAHDAVLIVPQSLIEGDNGLEIDREQIENPSGFRGADGLFRFGNNGLVERMLSIFEIRQGAFKEIKPAAEHFALPIELPADDGDTAAF